VLSEIAVESRYLYFPVKNDAPKRHVRLLAGGEVVRAFEIELAESEPDFWVSADLGVFIGQRLALEVDGLEPDASLLGVLCQSNVPAGTEEEYNEPLRPQFHFSSRRGWNNDPNGLLYYDGEYHLFYQHNPYGRRWGNMHWGHAISTDLVHWQELGDALYPDRLGTCFSGSGVVDWGDTAGLEAGAAKTLVCIFTSAGDTSVESQGQPFTQSIAYSNDRGRTWRMYPGNPVLGHVAARNRDPKVIWHAPTSRWVMALYLKENDYAMFASPDLKSWMHLCELTLPGASECPDFFPLPVDGNPSDTRWVFWGANGTYVLGQFDGQAFRQESPVLRYDWGGDSYAAQTWSDIPETDGRRIQIAWLRVELPGMPFNQQMTFPCELTLRTTPEGVRLFSQPVREIEGLRAREHHWRDVVLSPGQDPLAGASGELYDIRAEFEVGDAAQFGLAVRGIEVAYDVSTRQLTCLERAAPLAPQDGRIRLQVLVDRTSIEVFGNDGRVALPLGAPSDGSPGTLSAFARGGSAWIRSLDVYELRPAWR